MRKLLFVLFSLISLISKSQVYQAMPQYGYGPVKRFDIDSSLTIPTTCGVPTLRTTLTKKAAIAFDSCNNRFYQYNPKTLTWSVISGGGASTDTTSLSNRINAKADTSALNLKLNISDTINKWVTSVTKLNDSTISVLRNGTNTNITINGVSYAKKLKTQVWNNSGVTITKGSVIYINGKHSSNLPTIALAQANTELNSYSTFALVENDISNNSQGTVIQAGTIENLNLPTSTYTDGDLLYLSPTVAGGYTTTKPLAPYHIVKLGTIVRAHPTLGTIELKIENGWQLDELSDVQIPAVPNDSTLLQFSRVDSLWHSVSVTNAIGTNYLKPTDTTSLSNRINLKLNSSDTTSLSNRINIKLNSSDTSSLSNRINLKLNSSDTASLSNRINTKLNTSDSTIYYTKFRSDTSRTNIYNQLAQELNISDSTIYYTKFRSDTSRSNIYTSLSNKGYAINLGAASTNLVASSTYYFGIPILTVQATAALRRVYIPQSGTIKGGQIYMRATSATSTETWTLSIRLNNTTNTTFASTANNSLDKVFSATGLSISVVAGDYIEITTTTPAWSVAPGSTYIYGSIFIQ